MQYRVACGVFLTGALSLTLLLAGCNSEAPLVPLTSATGEVRGTLSSVGSASTSSGGKTVARRLISVTHGFPFARKTSEIVVGDRTYVAIDGAPVNSPYLGPKMGAIQRVELNDTARIVVSYEASSGPSLPEVGSEKYPVATRIEIDTAR